MWRNFSKVSTRVSRRSNLFAASPFKGAVEYAALDRIPQPETLLGFVDVSEVVAGRAAVDPSQFVARFFGRRRPVY